MAGSFQRLTGSRSGASAAVFALATPTLLAGAGFGIDSALIRVTQSQLQTAADAAALAGARQAGTGDGAAPAIALAAENMPAARFGQVLASGDVVSGRWSTDTRRFTSGAGSPNAVQVTVRQALANGNPHRLIFGQFIGLQQIDLAARATAVGEAVTVAAPGAPCPVRRDLAYLSNAAPTRTAIATLSDATPSDGMPARYYLSRDGYPIVRVSSGYDGEARVSFSVGGRGTYALTVPARGDYAVEVRLDAVRANAATSATAIAFDAVQSLPPAPDGNSATTAIWASPARTIDELPGTAVCLDGTRATGAAAMRTVIRARLVG